MSPRLPSVYQGDTVAGNIARLRNPLHIASRNQNDNVAVRHE
jgi:hypothetical protein